MLYFWTNLHPNSWVSLRSSFCCLHLYKIISRYWQSNVSDTSIWLTWFSNIKMSSYSLISSKILKFCFPISRFTITFPSLVFTSLWFFFFLGGEGENDRQQPCSVKAGSAKPQCVNSGPITVGLSAILWQKQTSPHKGPLEGYCCRRTLTNIFVRGVSLFVLSIGPS